MADYRVVSCRQMVRVRCLDGNPLPQDGLLDLRFAAPSNPCAAPRGLGRRFRGGKCFLSSDGIGLRRESLELHVSDVGVCTTDMGTER